MRFLPGIVAAAQGVKRRVQRADQVDRDEIGRGAGRLCRASVHVDAGHRRVRRRDAVRQKPADDAGEHVAGARGRERGAVGAVDTYLAVGLRDHGARPLQHDDRVRARRRARAPASIRSAPTPCPARRSYSAACGVRIAGGRPAACRTRSGDASTASAFERVGVHHDRKRCLRDEPASRGLGAIVATQARTDGERAEPTQFLEHEPRRFLVEVTVARRRKCSGDDLGTGERARPPAFPAPRTRPCRRRRARRREPRARARRACRWIRRTP